MSDIQKLKQLEPRIYDHPLFKVKHLYAGEIVILNEREFRGLWHPYKYDSPQIKAFAIFYNTDKEFWPNQTPWFMHIKSYKLLTTRRYARKGSFAIKNIQPFYEYIDSEELWDDLYKLNIDIKSPNTKLSLHNIHDLETKINHQLAPNQEATETFGL